MSGKWDVRLLVPQHSCSTVIGQKGANIKQIKEDTGSAFVGVHNDPLPNSDEHVVKVINQDIGGCVEAVYHVFQSIAESKGQEHVTFYDPQVWEKGEHGDTGSFQESPGDYGDRGGRGGRGRGGRGRGDGERGRGRGSFGRGGGGRGGGERGRGGERGGRGFGGSRGGSRGSYNQGGGYGGFNESSSGGNSGYYQQRYGDSGEQGTGSHSYEPEIDKSGTDNNASKTGGQENYVSYPTY